MLRCPWTIAQEAQPGGKSGTANLVSSCHQHVPWYTRAAHGMPPLDLLVGATGLHAPAGSRPLPREPMSYHHPRRTRKDSSPHSLAPQEKNKQRMIKLLSPDSSPAYACIYFVVCVREQALMAFADPCP